MELVEISYYILGAVAAVIGTLFSNRMMDDKRVVSKKVKKYNIRSRFLKKILKLSPTGWLFVICIISSLGLSIYKDSLDNAKVDKWQTEVLSMGKRADKANNNYLKKLANSEANHDRTMNTLLSQLDKWGLRIEDSFIVRKDGFVVLRPGENVATIDTNKGARTMAMTFFVCNKGNTEVGVTISIYFVKNDSATYAVPFGDKSFYHFAANDCTSFTNLFEGHGMAHAFKGHFLEKYEYVEKGVKKVDVYTISYADKYSTWAISSKDFSHLIK